MKKNDSPRNYPALIGYLMGMLGIFIGISLASSPPKGLANTSTQTIVMMVVFTFMIPPYYHLLRDYRRKMRLAQEAKKLEDNPFYYNPPWPPYNNHQPR